MSEIIKMNDSNFAEYANSELMLLDFGAEWCVHCHTIAPFIDEIASEMKGKLVAGQIDVDEAPMTAAYFRIRSLPTVLILKNGKVVKTIIGARPKRDFVKAIEEA